MAFLGSIGKFVSGAVKTLAPVLAPVAAIGTTLASKTPLGALATSVIGSFSQPATLAPGPGIFDSFQTALGGPFGFPQTPQPMMPQPRAIPTAAAVPALTQGVFNIIVKMAGALGIPIRSAGAVVRIGRSIVARLLRFARAHPGLTILNLLVNIGLTLQEANELITWYTVHGKRRRRIRVTNVKALNRSVRRLEGFRRLSTRVNLALAGRAVPRGRARARRCPVCRKSPCSC